MDMNKRALKLFDRLIDEASELKVAVQRIAEATVVDAGVECEGSTEAGLIITEICLGGLGRASLAPMNVGGLYLPCVYVTTDYPAVSTLASQFAGWKISHNGYFAMGSGPARAIVRKPKWIYKLLNYSEPPEVAVLQLEADKLPPESVVEKIARDLGVPSRNLHIVVAPTSSLAGSTQIAGRIVETGIHKLVDLGLNPSSILYGCGSAPIAPLHPDSAVQMGRTNDALMLGGAVYLVVKGGDKLEDIVPKAPASASPSYGKPFYEIFKEAGFDFYKIDKGLFAPAKIVVNDIMTGKTYSAGEINPQLLMKSFTA